MKTAFLLQWFSQARSEVAHFYRKLDGSKHPIPLCRCSEKGMGAAPEHHGQGFQLLHAMNKRVHGLCIRKVSSEVAFLFENPPP